jgi:hypothetical protein
MRSCHPDYRSRRVVVQLGKASVNWINLVQTCCARKVGVLLPQVIGAAASIPRRSNPDLPASAMPGLFRIHVAVQHLLVYAVAAPSRPLPIQFQSTPPAWWARMSQNVTNLNHSWCRCELRIRHPAMVDFHVDQCAQSVQGASVPVRSHRFVRALVSPVSALLPASPNWWPNGVSRWMPAAFGAGCRPMRMG